MGPAQSSVSKEERPSTNTESTSQNSKRKLDETDHEAGAPENSDGGDSGPVTEQTETEGYPNWDNILFRQPAEVRDMVSGNLDIRDLTQLSATSRLAHDISFYDGKKEHNVIYKRAVKEDEATGYLNQCDAFMCLVVRRNDEANKQAAIKYLQAGGSVSDQGDVFPAYIDPSTHRWPNHLADYNLVTHRPNPNGTGPSRLMNYAKTCFHAMEAMDMPGEDRIAWVQLILRNAKGVSLDRSGVFWLLHNMLVNHLGPELFCPRTTPALVRLLLTESHFANIPVHFSRICTGETERSRLGIDFPRVVQGLLGMLIDLAGNYFNAVEKEGFRRSWENCLSCVSYLDHHDEVKLFGRRPEDEAEPDYIFRTARMLYDMEINDAYDQPAFDIVDHIVDDNVRNRGDAAGRLAFLFQCMLPQPWLELPDI